MGLSRSTFYDAPIIRLDDAEIVRRMQTICDESRPTDIGASTPSFGIRASSSCQNLSILRGSLQ
jgi:hypothetical protein